MDRLQLNVLLLVVLGSQTAWCDAPLEDIPAVLQLTREEAKAKHPVSLEATVYYCDTRGYCFLGDEGNFICLDGIRQLLAPGTRVRVQGTTTWGEINNVIQLRSLEILGEVALSAPRAVVSIRPRHV